MRQHYKEKRFIFAHTLRGTREWIVDLCDCMTGPVVKQRIMVVSVLWGRVRERERKKEWEIIIMDTTICLQWPQTVCYILKGPSPPNCTTVWGPNISSIQVIGSLIQAVTVSKYWLNHTGSFWIGLSLSQCKISERCSPNVWKPWCYMPLEGNVESLSKC